MMRLVVVGAAMVWDWVSVEAVRVVRPLRLLGATRRGGRVGACGCRVSGRGPCVLTE